MAGQLSTEYLVAIRVKEQARVSRNQGQGKIVQKYGEIYSNIARRQIAEDEEEERVVVNIWEERLRKRQEKEEAKKTKASVVANQSTAL